MSFNARTDLAIESREIYLENSENATEINGVEAEEENCGQGINVTRVKIVNENGE